METGPPQERTSRIKPPNLERVAPWIRRHITEPFISFKGESHPNGKKLTEREQLAASRQQIRILVKYWRESGVPDEQIQTDLINLITKD